MSYIIWDGGDCLIFNSKQYFQADKYVRDNISMSDMFNGWLKSATGSNQVAVINQFDTIAPFSDAPNYLLPSTKALGDADGQS